MMRTDNPSRAMALAAIWALSAAACGEAEGNDTGTEPTVGGIGNPSGTAGNGVASEGPVNAPGAGTTAGLPPEPTATDVGMTPPVNAGNAAPAMSPEQPGDPAPSPVVLPPDMAQVEPAPGNGSGLGNADPTPGAPADDETPASVGTEMAEPPGAPTSMPLVEEEAEMDDDESPGEEPEGQQEQPETEAPEGDVFGPDIEGACTASQPANSNANGGGPYAVVVETNSDPGISEGTIFRPAELTCRDVRCLG